MSIQWPSLASVDGTLLTPPQEWKNVRREIVFRSQDQRLNTVHNGTSRGLRNMRGRGITFDEQMHEESPFPEEPDIRYEVELNQNMDFGDSESLDWSELDVDRDEGNLYQLNLNESLVYDRDTTSEEVLKGQDLGKTGLDTELLELHAIVYEEESGQRHLMHWDPGVYDSEGDKDKYRDNDGSPDLMEVAEDEEEMFENYDVMELEEGLDHIYDELIEGSEEIEQSARQEMLENSEQGTDDLDYSDQVIEDAWKAERWRGMADAVRNLNTAVQNGYGQKERISF